MHRINNKAHKAIYNDICKIKPDNIFGEWLSNRKKRKLCIYANWDKNKIIELMNNEDFIECYFMKD